MQAKNNIPQLRFPEFTDAWQANKLATYFEVSKERNTDGKFTKNDVFSVSGGHGVINQIELQGRSFAGASVLNYHVVDQYDIVYTKSPLKANPYGIVKYNSGSSGIVSTLYAVYKPRENIDSKFVDYYFQLDDHTNKYLRPLVHKGSKNDMKINNQHVLSGEVIFPHIEEQEKITEFLTAVDERIAASEKKLAQLQQYKKGVMQKIFTQAVRFKDTNGAPYPEWKEKRLGDIGKTYTGLTGKSGSDFGSGADFVTYMQIFSNSRIDVTKFSQVKISPDERQNKVKQGDIFFTTSSETPQEVGYTSVILDNVSDVYLNSFCFGYRADKTILATRFARYFFHSQNIRAAISRLAQGSTRFNLSKNELMKMAVNLPSLEEQQKIATFLTTLDAKIAAEQTRLTAAKQWKKGLLQRMFI